MSAIGGPGGIGGPKGPGGPGGPEGPEDIAEVGGGERADGAHEIDAARRPRHLALSAE